MKNDKEKLGFKRSSLVPLNIYKFTIYTSYIYVFLIMI